MKTHRTLHGARRALIAAAAAGAAGATLSGCFPLAAGGMAYGALVVTDRRTLGAQTEDTGIEVKARAQLSQEIRQSGGIGVVSFNRKVLLYGQVADDAARRTAEQVVARLENVRTVHNELAVSGRTSIGTAANDTAITTKVKAALVDAKDLQANAFKVITEAGIVYLMGIVTRAEGDRAASLASRTSGVLRVVTVFEYVTEDELARIVYQSKESRDGAKK
ncbi:MAG: BON domain-containing protein [Burkholderiaceae bacterium]